jgi:hypothetical protein
MSHKNFLMWVFSTLDLSKTREFHECVLGFNGRRRASRGALTPGRGPRAHVSRDRKPPAFKAPHGPFLEYRTVFLN